MTARCDRRYFSSGLMDHLKKRDIDTTAAVLQCPVPAGQVSRRDPVPVRPNSKLKEAIFQPIPAKKSSWDPPLSTDEERRGEPVCR